MRIPRQILKNLLRPAEGGFTNTTHLMRRACRHRASNAAGLANAAISP